MRKWLSQGWETFKIFIVFTACLLTFYYGILWLSESYDGDERLQRTETDAKQVQAPEESIMPY
ncbi:DUF4227 family protein [Salibacterium aidingense]|uniref:DUF4227 family protein n=1 Tax=Salibacterium aidingense TaxID=384933 RepID=UPI003BC552B9